MKLVNTNARIALLAILLRCNKIINIYLKYKLELINTNLSSE